MPRERNPWRPTYHELRAASSESLEIKAAQSEAWVKEMQRQARQHQGAVAAMRKELKRRRREARDNRGRGDA